VRRHACWRGREAWRIVAGPEPRDSVRASSCGSGGELRVLRWGVVCCNTSQTILDADETDAPPVEWPLCRPMVPCPCPCAASSRLVSSRLAVLVCSSCRDPCCRCPSSALAVCGVLIRLDRCVWTLVVPLSLRRCGPCRLRATSRPCRLCSASRHTCTGRNRTTRPDPTTGLRTATDTDDRRLTQRDAAQEPTKGTGEETEKCNESASSPIAMSTNSAMRPMRPLCSAHPRSLWLCEFAVAQRFVCGQLGKTASSRQRGNKGRWNVRD
jgi:hypothetical protein